jgi:hypothetical protein
MDRIRNRYSRALRCKEVNFPRLALQWLDEGRRFGGPMETFVRLWKLLRLRCTCSRVTRQSSYNCLIHSSLTIRENGRRLHYAIPNIGRFRSCSSRSSNSPTGSEQPDSAHNTRANNGGASAAMGLACQKLFSATRRRILACGKDNVRTTVSIRYRRNDEYAAGTSLLL